MSATPIGIIIVAVAVLVIQSEMKAVAARTPASSRRGSVPIPCMMPSARRRWRFHCCIAAAIAMPPAKRKM
jgi:hypothetical protein